MIPFLKKNWIIVISILLYLISLTQTAFCARECPDGAFALIGGVFTLLGSPYAIPWLANPLLFLSWYWWYHKPKRALYCVLAALLCGFSFLLFEKAVVSSQGEYTITGYGEGYWLWLGSMIWLLFGYFLDKRARLS